MPQCRLSFCQKLRTSARLSRNLHTYYVVLKPFENTDLQTLGAHVVRLARAGVRPLVAGTMGEGIHLAHGERASLVLAVRNALDAEGFFDVPIIVGTGGGSTRETVVLCKEVAVSGADAVIVITPGYFSG